VQRNAFLYLSLYSNFKVPPVLAPVSENVIFGVPLDDLMDRQRKKNPDSTVPNVVEQCFQYICKYGMFAAFTSSFIIYM
jgi:hypothetical protein